MSNTHINDLRDTLTHARLCYEGWWLFECAHPKRQEIVSAYNQHLDFFHAVHPALYVTFVIKLASVFGTRNDEISLKSISGVDQIAGFSELWDRGRRFHKYRSKIVAHRDINIATNTFIPGSGCRTNASLKQLLDDTCQLFDDAAERLNVGGVHPCTLEEDFLNLVSVLSQDQTHCNPPHEVL